MLGDLKRFLNRFCFGFELLFLIVAIFYMN